MSTKKSPKISICRNPECEKEFEVKPATKGMYCCMTCAARMSSKKSAEKNRGKQLCEYIPKTCIQCEAEISYKQRNNKFCSHSCRAVYVNTKRPRKNPDKVIKPSKPRKYLYPKPEHDMYTSVSVVFINCISCGKLFVTRAGYVRKTCSQVCKNSRLSENAKSLIETNKWNRGRHKRSYLETSFAAWLDQFDIKYRQEVTFKNVITGKWYYADFVIDSKQLVVELDGTQHIGMEEYDKIKDDFIRSLGYQVIRISHKEYRNKSKLSELIKVLELPVGIEPTF